MDIREFSNKIAEATKNMSDEERTSLMKMFESVSGDISTVTPAHAQPAPAPGGSHEHPAYYSSIAAATTQVDEESSSRPDRASGKTEREFLKAGSVHYDSQSACGNEDHQGEPWYAEDRTSCKVLPLLL